MARIYLSDLTSSVSGYKIAFVDTRSPITTGKATSTTTVPVAAATGTTTAITDTIAAGNVVKWITEPFLTAVTIAGSTRVVGWISGTSVGAGRDFGLNCNLQQYSGAAEVTTPSLQVDVVRSKMAQTSEAQQFWLPTRPTSTAFAVGDRLAININAVSLGSTTPTQTVILTYDGNSEGLSGDTFVEITEAIRVGSRQTATTRGASLPGEGRGQFQEIVNKLSQFVAAGVIASNATTQAIIDDLTNESARN